MSPLTPTIGAEIGGIDLSKPVDGAMLASLREALLEWKVIFFRDQEITTEEHLAFARQFGELEVHPFAPHKEGYPEVLAITHNRERPGKENKWHSDVTWRECPSLGSVLRAVEVPDVGGDTLFSDMYAAYDGLSDEVKERIDGAIAIHDFAHFRKMMQKLGKTPEEIEEMNRKYPMVEHPVVRTHPETGRKGIYVNIAFTQHIAQHGQGGVRRTARASLRAGRCSRISVPLPLAEELDSLLGQSRLPALCGIRLLAERCARWSA